MAASTIRLRGSEHDEVRTRYLQHRGIRVLRFSDRDVLVNGEAVPAVIEARRQERVSRDPIGPTELLVTGPLP